MKKVLAVVALFAAGAVVFAQEAKNPVSTVVKETLVHRQKNLVEAAEEMPADKYSYKPTPEQMSFGHLVMHVMESNNHLCATIADTAEPKNDVKESDGKDKLVSALKASFDFCSTALAKVDDSKLGDTVELFGGRKGPRAAAMFAMTGGWADHYSAAAIYLRLNGLLPPSAKKEK